MSGDGNYGKGGPNGAVILFAVVIAVVALVILFAGVK